MGIKSHDIRIHINQAVSFPFLFQVYVRLGYDPRKNPESRFLQAERVKVNSQLVSMRCISDLKHIGMESDGGFEMIQNALNIIESFRQGGLKVGISSGMLFFEDSSSGD